MTTGIEDLTAELIAAAKLFRENEEGTPSVVYAQLSRTHGWTAAFAKRENHLEMTMTRWSTGEDVVALFTAILAGNKEAVQDYAGDIIGGWEDEWTD